METETDHLHLAGPTACELITPEDEDDLRARLGPDPILDPADGADELGRRLSRRSISIGAALLDQKVVAGIGNVYRSELLFLAGIHPLTVAKSLEPWAIDDIWRRSVVALTDGEKMGKIVTVLPDEMGVESPASSNAVTGSTSTSAPARHVVVARSRSKRRMPTGAMSGGARSASPRPWTSSSASLLRRPSGVGAAAVRFGP